MKFGDMVKKKFYSLELCKEEWASKEEIIEAVEADIEEYEVDICPVCRSQSCRGWGCLKSLSDKAAEAERNIKAVEEALELTSGDTRKYLLKHFEGMLVTWRSATQHNKDMQERAEKLLQV